MAWACLPFDLLCEITPRIPCEVDRVNLQRVCHSWRAFAKELEALRLPLPPPPPKLPWLLRLSAAESNSSCLLSGVNEIGRVHRVRVPDDLLSARYFGSFDGGWLFLASHRKSGHMLLNLRDERRVTLPDVLPSSPGGAAHPMIMLAATLSAPPDADGCVVGAAIVHIGKGDDRSVAFWLMGMEIAVPPFRPICHYKLNEINDVVYYSNSFYVLEGWDLNVFVPELDHGDLILHREWRWMRRPEHTYQFTPQWLRIQAVGQYLVESRGELLLVIKNNPKARSMFTVFKMTETDGNGVDGAILYSWSDVSSLDGRMLFVGHGCSRSYETTDFPGFQEGIYFLDDQWVFQYQIDSIIQRLRCCRSDNGRYSSGPPPMVTRCFPLEQDTSECSSLVWLL